VSKRNKQVIKRLSKSGRKISSDTNIHSSPNEQIPSPVPTLLVESPEMPLPQTPGRFAEVKHSVVRYLPLFPAAYLAMILPWISGIASWITRFAALPLGFLTCTNGGRRTRKRITDAAKSLTQGIFRLRDNRVREVENPSLHPDGPVVPEAAPLQALPALFTFKLLGFFMDTTGEVDEPIRVLLPTLRFQKPSILPSTFLEIIRLHLAGHEERIGWAVKVLGVTAGGLALWALVPMAVLNPLRAGALFMVIVSCLSLMSELSRGSGSFTTAIRDSISLLWLSLLAVALLPSIRFGFRPHMLATYSMGLFGLLVLVLVPYTKRIWFDPRSPIHGTSQTELNLRYVGRTIRTIIVVSRLMVPSLVFTLATSFKNLPLLSQVSVPLAAAHFARIGFFRVRSPRVVSGPGLRLRR
jgi:hypothetical protein